MTADDAIASARAVHVAIDAVRVGMALTGRASTAAADRADVLAAAAEDAYDAPAGFGAALVDLMWHLAREAAPESGRLSLTGLLGAVDGRADDAIWTALDAAVIAALAIVALRRDYPARQDASAARAHYTALAEPVTERVGAVLGVDAHDWLAGIVGRTAVALSAVAASRAPLVRVETGLSMPSTRLAYDLYQAPDRARELVARNRVATPVFMPVSIEALAS